MFLGCYTDTRTISIVFGSVMYFSWFQENVLNCRQAGSTCFAGGRPNNARLVFYFSELNYFRYLEDAQLIRDSQREEIYECRQHAKNLMKLTSRPYLIGNDILHLLQRHIMEWSTESILTSLRTKEAARKIRRKCQMMLIHGNLVPVTTGDPEMYQKFSLRYRLVFYIHTYIHTYTTM